MDLIRAWTNGSELDGEFEICLRDMTVRGGYTREKELPRYVEALLGVYLDRQELLIPDNLQDPDELGVFETPLHFKCPLFEASRFTLLEPCASSFHLFISMLYAKWTSMNAVRNEQVTTGECIALVKKWEGLQLQLKAVRTVKSKHLASIGGSLLETAKTPYPTSERTACQEKD